MIREREGEMAKKLRSTRGGGMDVCGLKRGALTENKEDPPVTLGVPS